MDVAKASSPGFGWLYSNPNRVYARHRAGVLAPRHLSWHIECAARPRRDPPFLEQKGGRTTLAVRKIATRGSPMRNLLGHIGVGLGLLGAIAASPLVVEAHRLPKAQVRMTNGRPQLFINGRQTPPLLLFVNIINLHDRINASQSAAEIRLAARAGIHLFSLQLPSGLADPPGGFKYRRMNRWFAFILRNDPRAYIYPRVRGGGIFRWRHRSQLIAHANGTHPGISPASGLWYRAAKRGMAALVRHIRESPYSGRVIGVMLLAPGNGECFPVDYWHNPGFDYSRPNQIGFARWLKRRYRTNTALRAAWHNARVTFLTAAIPHPIRPNPYPFYLSAERSYVDYLNYQSDLMASRVAGLAAVVKRLTAGRWLVNVFYGYGFELPTPDSSHLAVERLLRAPGLDALGSPMSYVDRGPAGSPAFMGAVDSATLHGKFWITEDDTGTFVDTPEDRQFPHSGPLYAFSRPPGSCANLQQLVAVQRRNFGMLMIHRLATWWMDVSGAGQLNNGSIWRDIGQLREAYVKYAPKTQFEPSVAVIYDPRSEAYARMGSGGWGHDMPLLGALLFNPVQFYHCGTSIGFYALCDLAMPDFPPAKVVIFLNAWRVGTATRRVIRRKLERNGRTLIWIYGAGFIDGRGRLDAGAASRLIGIHLRLREPSDLIGSQTIEPSALGLPAEHIAGLGAVAAGLQRYGGMPFGRAADTPSFAVDDPTSVALARYRNTHEVSIALKRFHGYQSLFIGETRPSAAFWRALFPHFGVPIYLDTDDAFETDGRLMMISSDGVVGPRLLTLPQRGSIYNILNGEKLAAEVRRYRFRLGRYQTKLLLVTYSKGK